MKMGILRNCLADLGGDHGLSHCGAGTIVDMPRTEAHKLAMHRLAVYMRAADDPSHGNTQTYRADLHGPMADPVAPKAPEKTHVGA